MRNRLDKKLPSPPPKAYPFGFKKLMDLFDISPVVASAVIGVSAVILLSAVLYFASSAPPTTITISTGPEGSIFQKNALKYAKVLKENGIQLNVVTSQGSLENLERVANSTSAVDVGIVQAGIVDSVPKGVVSLGSISYQPMLIFYRGKELQLLSQLVGKRISIGPSESGTHKFALALLSANGVRKEAKTEFLDLAAVDAAREISNGEIDAAFIMSESASSEILKSLVRSKQVHLFNFKQANAYSRKIDYLNVLDLPEGTIDFGQDIPPHDMLLVGPMVELVAKKTLHPALSDLLIEAAIATHGRPGVFQHRGEFPAPIEHMIPISEDAKRFYKSGKTTLYRYMPFWLASITSRIIIAFLPTLVLLIPILRMIPAFFRWRAQSKIYQQYRDLLVLENRFLSEKDTAERERLRERFDRIEEAVNRMKIPASFADQFYGLRGHIDYVRKLVDKRGSRTAGTG